MKKSELRQLIKEVLDVKEFDDLNHDEIIKKLVHKSSDIYDFGGGEGGGEGAIPGSTIVDILSKEEGDNEEGEYIQHDLKKYIKLPPKKGIYLNASLYQIEPNSNLAKTINDALVSGGYVVVTDYKRDIDKLKKLLGYKEIYQKELDPDEHIITLVLQK